MQTVLSTAALDGLMTQALIQFPAPVMITDDTGNILWVNQALCDMSGYAAAELLGRTPALLKSGSQDPAFYQQLWNTIRGGRVWRGEIVDRRKDGSQYIAEEVVAPLRDELGAVRHFVAVQHDITERESRRKREHYLAYHDILTSLPNRAMLQEIAQKAVSGAVRSEQLIAMMFLDLDGFKSINDTLGHYIGDQLLVAVAERMQSGVRQSDTIARIGGDEFAVLITALDSRATVAPLAQKLLDTLARPFSLRGHQFCIRASIGIAIFPSDAADVESLLRCSDRAMYQAKLLGGQRYRFFEPGTTQDRSDWPEADQGAQARVPPLPNLSP
ncbi:sensor domain-containing diguanylate cyclase [Massilia scottii]|uniref:sensor domain-containing diguanylate cyclase n=1 Tax=Massilia scottii TaxID=3057166 RepID=UPI0027969AD4|nr:sensor domain-containing diguanylate cyclase [Massilia sp. CCM 9029]MDQ1831646.1 sensor domain-containing diguanylate cyclase [Massilia sp. CCM 9029]